MNLVFFPQFQSLTLYQLEMELHDFFVSLFMKLSWSCNQVTSLTY